MVSQTFDPLGLFSSVLIRGKILLQDLWLENKDWDDLTSEDFSRKFRDYINDLKNVQKLTVPRPLFAQSDVIYAFCDVSESAYYAVLYVSFTDNRHNKNFRLICAKTRVAPLKRLSTPKLELSAAKLLASLSKTVIAILQNEKFELDNIFEFTDSTAVFCWLLKPANSWKMFVKNNVEKIVSIIPFQN